MAAFKAALGFEASADFIAVGLSERLKKNLQDSLDFASLIIGEVVDRAPLKSSFLSLEADQVLRGHAVSDKGFFLL